MREREKENDGHRNISSAFLMAGLCGTQYMDYLSRRELYIFSVARSPIDGLLSASG